MLTLESPAKINLFLEIVRRRDDGYHEIDTVMQELSLADTITLSARADGRLTLACDTPGIPVDATNLMVKAAEVLRAETGVTFGADMALVKRIPAGGGMGGGSSNAATALAGLNRLWQTNLSDARMLELAARIGSDVAFFVNGGTARCTGRGERIEPLEPCPPLWLVLVFPEWGVSTPAAYRALDPATFGRYDGAAFARTLAHGDTEAIGAALFNRFEDAVFAMEPREGVLFKELGLMPFVAARMSGSGSTLFGVARSETDATALAKNARTLPGVREAVAVRTVARD